MLSGLGTNRLSAVKVKLTLEYAGEAFSGFQRQAGQQTVQGCLEEALRVVFAGYAKKLSIEPPAAVLDNRIRKN